MKGTIKRFYFKKGFGFIENDAGEELFFHYTDFDGPKKLLRSDVAVTFTESEGKKGLSATDLQVDSYDPDSDPDREQHEQERAARPPRSKKASNKSGSSWVTGLIFGLLIGGAVGYYLALNMPIGG
jgi:CspA family cold shock protein